MSMTINNVSLTASVVANPSSNTKASRGHETEHLQQKEVISGIQSRAEVAAFAFNSKSRGTSYGEERSVDASFEGEENKEDSKEEKKEEGKSKKSSLSVKA